MMFIENSLRDKIFKFIIKKYPGVKTLLTEDVFEKRVMNDIADIADRITHGEYYLHDFSSKSKFDVNGRMKEFYIYLDSYVDIARGWEKIFSLINIHEDTKIVNIGPGWSPKIELGLYYHNFKGDIEICDVDKNCSKNIRKFMNIFNYEFKIQQKTYDFLDKSKKINKYDVVLGNHIVDDLLIHSILSKVGTNSNYYEAENINFFTNNILSGLENQELNTFVIDFVDALDRHLKEGGYVVLNHYKSYVDDLNNNDLFYKFCVRTLTKIKDLLYKKGYINNFKNIKGISKLYFKSSDYFILKKS